MMGKDWTRHNVCILADNTACIHGDNEFKCKVVILSNFYVKNGWMQREDMVLYKHNNTDPYAKNILLVASYHLSSDSLPL